MSIPALKIKKQFKNKKKWKMKAKVEVKEKKNRLQLKIKEVIEELLQAAVMIQNVKMNILMMLLMI